MMAGVAFVVVEPKTYDLIDFIIPLSMTNRHRGIYEPTNRTSTITQRGSKPC